MQAVAGLLREMQEFQHPGNPVGRLTACSASLYRLPLLELPDSGCETFGDEAEKLKN